VQVRDGGYSDNRVDPGGRLGSLSFQARLKQAAALFFSSLKTQWFLLRSCWFPQLFSRAWLCPFPFSPHAHTRKSSRWDVAGVAGYMESCVGPCATLETRFRRHEFAADRSRFYARKHAGEMICGRMYSSAVEPRCKNPLPTAREQGGARRLDKGACTEGSMCSMTSMFRPTRSVFKNPPPSDSVPSPERIFRKA
jgi:hypothetical protein